MLRITARLNIQSFMGAIMAIGIAVANSILLVTFSERARRENEAVAGGGAGGRGEPAAGDFDDGGGDDFRHAADGDRIWRGRVASGASGAGGDRRSDGFDIRDADDSSFDLRDFAGESVGGVAVSQPAWIPRAGIMMRR